ncbi:MAG: saccharopine dehydrogenase C-terminal domain-containing protein [Acidobacteriota bacterium]
MESGAHRYAVLGAGRQGQAAAYDLAVRGEAREILLADADPARAHAAREWLAARLPAAAPALSTATVDGGDENGLRAVLVGRDAAVSALPYRFNLGATRAAIAAGCPLCDLGGHTGITREQLALGGAATARGVAIVPDCGQAPGMATSLMVLALSLVDEPHTLEVWDGGLPLDPQPPLGYRLLFSVEGLTNEYDGPCYNLRDGKVVNLDSLSEAQQVEFPPPLGRLEAFCASGTASTFPWTWEGRLRTFTSRILRYPGHLEQIRTLKRLGFFGEEEVSVGGRPVVPRRLTEALLERLLQGEGPIRDIVLVRVHATGHQNGRPARAEIDARVDCDPAIGLSAMQRCTGFDAAIVAAMLARGEIRPGVHTRETAVEPERYASELDRRGMGVARRVVAL